MGILTLSQLYVLFLFIVCVDLKSCFIRLAFSQISEGRHRRYHGNYTQKNLCRPKPFPLTPNAQADRVQNIVSDNTE